VAAESNSDVRILIRSSEIVVCAHAPYTIGHVKKWLFF